MGKTLGSLFDGIGGFPLAAVTVGITPVWASEIEAAPVSITKRHFSGMRHLGDITKINGGDIEPADIITFGSPCQDLSVAGKRAGLQGKRSSLFMQAVRIIKEMRIATNGKYPARIVWENVPGAFSSHNGLDFQTVINEISQIAEQGVFVPRPSEKCGWLASGGVLGDCFSLAWRCLDAQYFDVPQRRRRIFLVADFTGRCAGEILLKPEGLQGGILRRAKAKGKVLPEILRRALHNMR
jgi:DNA (cytosine-5)-methyltransferase 1